MRPAKSFSPRGEGTLESPSPLGKKDRMRGSFEDADGYAKRARCLAAAIDFNERIHQRLTAWRLALDCNCAVLEPHTGSGFFDPDMRGWNRPACIIECPRRYENQVGRRQRLVPQADAASGAADDVDLPARIRALAVAQNVTLFVDKGLPHRQHHHNAGGARELFAIVAVTRIYSQRPRIEPVAGRAAQAAALVGRRGDGWPVHANSLSYRRAPVPRSRASLRAACGLSLQSDGRRICRAWL